ncbi:MAG: ROK family protein [bacterium]|nr:ROK family protein [bacterium]
MRELVEPVAAIGVDYGGTELKAVLGNAVEVIGEPVRLRLGRAIEAEQVVAEVAGVVQLLSARAADANVSVAGVCLVIPGRVNPDLGRGEFSANLGWADFAIGPELEAVLGQPVLVEHDVYAGALAEFSIGAGRGLRSGAFVPVGTGMAAAVLLDGRIWRGATRFAGEIGHVCTSAIGATANGEPSRCVESAASGRGIERAYAELVGGDEYIEAKEIAVRAAAGEQAASVVWQECVDTLARSLSTLALTLDVEAIVVGGGLSQAGGQLFDPLASAMAKELASVREVPELRSAALGQTAGARGAALHALATPLPTPSSRVAVASSPKLNTSSCLESTQQPKFMLAFDHRASTATELFNSQTVSVEQWALLADAKTVIAEAVISSLQVVGHLGEVSVLVDMECGEAAARVAQSGGIDTALALEVSGQRQLVLLDEAQMETSSSILESAKWGKVLLRWNPNDPMDLKEANLAALQQARSICAGFGMDLLLELIVPPTASDMEHVGDDAARYRSEMLPGLLAVAVGEITERFGLPDLWKLQGVASASKAAAVSEACCVDGVVPPIVILGAGAPRDEIATWLRAGAGVRGYAGFAIGRSIWKAPIAGLLSGQMDRVAVRDEIVARFTEYVNDYMVAARVSLVAGCS